MNSLNLNNISNLIFSKERQQIGMAEGLLILKDLDPGLIDLSHLGQ
jgi:hypothetical protein